MRILFASVMMITFETSSALAGIVTKCESPAGYAYYFSGALVPQAKAGWKRDGLSKGRYFVTRDAAGGYDIMFTDALNRTISSREDGGHIVEVSQSDDHLILIVTYPGIKVETWYFNIDRMGIGKLTISQAKYQGDAFVHKHSLMMAVCSR